MDLEATVRQIDGVNQRKIEEAGQRTFYVMPYFGETPDDGVLSYAQVSSVYDLKDIAERTVLMFAEEDFDVLECAAVNQGLFDVALVVMLGVPRAEYSVAFESVVWNLERVSYAPFLSELNIAIEAERQRDALSENQYDVERKHYTRKTGEVKKHDALLYSNIDEPAAEVDIADDSEGDA